MSLTAPVDWDTEQMQALRCSSEEDEATKAPTKKRLVFGSLLMAAGAAGAVMYFGRTPGQAGGNLVGIDSTAIIQDSTGCKNVIRQCHLGEQVGFVPSERGLARVCGLCQQEWAQGRKSAAFREFAAEHAKLKLHLYAIDPTLWFVLLNDGGKAGKCPGKPPFGWGNLGTDVTQEECESACGKKKTCKYFSINLATKSCTEFETCEEIELKNFFASWAKEHVDDPRAPGVEVKHTPRAEEEDQQGEEEKKDGPQAEEEDQQGEEKKDGPIYTRYQNSYCSKNKDDVLKEVDTIDECEDFCSGSPECKGCSAHCTSSCVFHAIPDCGDRRPSGRCKGDCISLKA